MTRIRFKHHLFNKADATLDHQEGHVAVTVSLGGNFNSIGLETAGKMWLIFSDKHLSLSQQDAFTHSQLGLLLTLTGCSLNTDSRVSRATSGSQEGVEPKPAAFR